MSRKNRTSVLQNIAPGFMPRVKVNTKQKHRTGRKSFQQLLSQLLCLLIVFSILTNTVPAAPQTIIGTAGEIAQDVRFGFLSSNSATNFPQWFAGAFLLSKSPNENNRIDRVQIYPGSVTVKQGKLLVLSAVGYNSENEPLSGIEFDWRMRDSQNRFAPRRFHGGKFKSSLAGTFIITAKSRGREAEVTVIVTPDATPGQNRATQAETSSIEVSSRSNKSSVQSESETLVKEEINEQDSGGTPSKIEMALPDVNGWNNTNWQSAGDPGNQTGNPPGTPAADGAGTGNFQLSAPIISLPGRGIDLALNLNYNSRLWNKSGSELTYDIDRGFPGPGWSLGFGKVAFMGTQGGCMMVDADGTRHGYTGQASSNSGLTYFTGNTTDGSFIDYGCSIYPGESSYAWANLPNGTQIIYSMYGPANDHIYPTLITDAQGNYISITYRNGLGPQLETITDTMGRIISFNYDASNRLINITAPRLLKPGVSKTTRTLVRFHYRQLQLGYSFASGINAIANNSPWVLDAVYYPATNTGYWFDDTDSYSSYGMLTKVIEQRGMNWQTSADEQGIITAGQMTKQALYNYPLTATNETGRTNGSNLSDAPIYDKLTESWAGMDVAEPAVTTYDIQQNASPRVTTVKQPNGAVSKQFAYNYSSLPATDPNKFKDGLVYQDETYVPDPSGTITFPNMPNFTGTFKLVGKSTVDWLQGDYQSPRPNWTEIFDENNHKIRTEFDYTGSLFNQVARSCDYDNGGARLRCTVNEYQNDQRYVGRHIFNLVKSTRIENPDGTFASWTDYEYDNYQSQPFTPAPGVIQHDYTHDPYTTELTNGACRATRVFQCGEPVPCTECIEYYQVSAYDPSTEARGNITKVTTYTDAQNRTTGAIDETRSYDITGNLTKTSTACCQQTSFQYTSANQYAYPESQTRGASDPNSPDRITTSAVYSYETGLITQSTDADGRVTTTSYNSDTLRPTKATSSTGAYQTFGYDDAAMTVTEEVFEAGGVTAGKTVKILNGVGQTKREESRGANGVWDYVEIKYNNLGQVWKQSRPFRTGDTVQWSETIYDKQGRTIKVIEPDGSFSQAFYNEAQRPGSAANLPGNTMRVTDAWGRERWGRYDQQNRLVEVVEPNPDRTVNSSGSVLSPNSLVTKYQYDTLGRLTQTEQDVQQRKFKYDSLGRLTRQKLAEQTATLKDDGTFVGAGQTGAQWSEAFGYDTRSNLTQKTDARGVRTSYAYYNLATGAEDPLNRLQAVFYDTTGPLEPNLTIQAAYNVTYEYMTTGDKSRIKKVETPGLMKEEYVYDSQARVSDYTQTIAARESYPMTTSYLYDTLDRVKEVRYPAQYGMTSSPRRIVEHFYDTASRLTSLKVNGTEQAGNIIYNAADQTTTIKIGAAGANQVTENYTFDPQTGLLTNQKAQTSGQTLLDLSYEYDRKNSVGTGNGKTGHLSKIVNNLDGNKNREYEYDALGRLTKAKGGSNLWTQQYAYDRYGNRESVTASGAAADGSAIPRDGIANLSYNTQNNRITTSGFEYDAAGNQTRALAEDGTSWLKFEYDAANRLRLVKRDDDTYLQAYTYSATNARIISYDYSLNYLTLYASLGGTTLSEYTESTPNTPSWTKSYIYLGDSLLSTATPNGAGGEVTDYSHPDRLGTRIITNQQAGTSYEQTTLPFGTALNAESTANTNKRFTSYDRSAATGLDYAVNRTYDSKQGRFTQVDPIKMSAVSLGSPQTLNLYTYCGNDPINHTDPDGLFFGKLFKWLAKAFKWIALAVGIAVMVLSMVVAPGSIGIWAKVLGVLMKIHKFIGMATLSFSERAISIGYGIYINTVISGVGAVANSLREGNNKKKQDDKQNLEILSSTIKNTLKRLRKNSKCLKTIMDASPENPINVLEKVSKIHLPNLSDVAIAPVGKGSEGTIYFGDKFFKKSVGGWTRETGMNSQRTREFIILHELLHLSGSDHKNIIEVDEHNTKILKDCFGVTPQR
ncbi:MAG: RHS repeat-associated core domain-containing protein [Tatlockia sp.]|jgi:RHS repeat-associated protein|nr:RHS repeat-associated core domain-containing protein [Tatlockia sp.]